jgi:phage shock protein E
MQPHRSQLRSLLTFSLAALAGIACLAVAEEHTRDSLDTVKKSLAANKAILVDVREKAEWDKGHLRDAQLLSLSVLQDKPSPAVLQQVLSKDKAIYLHCAAGVRCLKAAEILRKQGYDVRPLKEGYQSLLKQGFSRAAD